MNTATQMCQCDNCTWTGPATELGRSLDELPGLVKRLDPGSEVPAGECPKCGALAYIIDPTKERDTMSNKRHFDITQTQAAAILPGLIAARAWFGCAPLSLEMPLNKLRLTIKNEPAPLKIVEAATKTNVAPTAVLPSEARLLECNARAIKSDSGHPAASWLLECSTAHMTQQDSEALRERIDADMTGFMAAATDAGFFVRVHEFRDPQSGIHEATRDQDVLSDAFIDFCTWAANQGFDTILFDRDAAPVEGQPTFEW